MKPTLLVLAAGMGSRYGGVKQIDAVGLHNETLLDFATYDAKKCGFGKIVYIIRKDIEKDFRTRLFDRVARNMDAEYVFQSPDAFLSPEQQKASSARTKPWGTVHALICARDVLASPFAVINADDYYGRSAFETMGQYLSGIDAHSREHAMVGFVLGNTLSKSGSVSRALCEVKDGYLVSMQEHTKICYEGERIVSINGGSQGTDAEAKKITLTGTEWASMNFFGFSLAALDHFVAFFEAFIAKNASSEKAECLLPEAASVLVSEGKGKIKFHTSKESWFGMTYPPDREIVKAQISQKIADGYYPAQLWDE